MWDLHYPVTIILKPEDGNKEERIGRDVCAKYSAVNANTKIYTNPFTGAAENRHIVVTTHQHHAGLQHGGFHACSRAPLS